MSVNNNLPLPAVTANALNNDPKVQQFRQILANTDPESATAQATGARLFAYLEQTYGTITGGAIGTAYLLDGARQSTENTFRAINETLLPTQEPNSPDAKALQNRKMAIGNINQSITQQQQHQLSLTPLLEPAPTFSNAQLNSLRDQLEANPNMSIPEKGVLFQQMQAIEKQVGTPEDELKGRMLGARHMIHDIQTRQFMPIAVALANTQPGQANPLQIMQAQQTLNDLAAQQGRLVDNYNYHKQILSNVEGNNPQGPQTISLQSPEGQAVLNKVFPNQSAPLGLLEPDSVTAQSLQSRFAPRQNLANLPLNTLPNANSNTNALFRAGQATGITILNNTNVPDNPIGPITDINSAFQAGLNGGARIGLLSAPGVPLPILPPGQIGTTGQPINSSTNGVPLGTPLPILPPGQIGTTGQPITLSTNGIPLEQFLKNAADSGQVKPVEVGRLTQAEFNAMPIGVQEKLNAFEQSRQSGQLTAQTLSDGSTIQVAPETLL